MEGANPATVRAFLSLGSNIGDRRKFLRDAVGAIDDVRAVSPVYETEPVGGVEQDAFLNVVVEVHTIRSPQELLALCHELEQAAERTREVRWGPRTLDVDVVWIDGYSSDDPELTVPHPRAHERNFVQVPLFDLDPNLTLPNYDPAAAFGAVQNVGPL
ncbi:MAG: 2-amino-4-hydroxy-6-hydroxymethyldihydropteridine diphosphokinase [Acidimicrobiales bacterium]